MVQLWKLPAGAILHSEGLEQWNYSLPAALKSVKLFEGSEIDEECPKIPLLDEYGRFLLENPRMIGEVNIDAKSSEVFNKKRRAIEKKLRNRKIEGKRLKFRFVRGAGNDIEYWLSRL